MANISMQRNALRAAADAEPQQKWALGEAI